MTSPYMNTRDVALYLRFVDAEGRPNLKLAWKYIHTHVKPEFLVKRGRTVLVDRDGLQESLRRIA